MIYRYVKSKATIKELNRGRKVSEREILAKLEMGLNVEYRDAQTRKDLLPSLQRRQIFSLIGPDKPLYVAKQHPCMDCGVMSVNRFRCSTCWTHESLNGGIS